MTIGYKAARDIKPGDQIIESQGGMAWRVDSVARRGLMVALALTLCEEGMCVVKPSLNQSRSFRATTRLAVVA